MDEYSGFINSGVAGKMCRFSIVYHGSAMNSHRLLFILLQSVYLLTLASNSGFAFVKYHRIEI